MKQALLRKIDEDQKGLKALKGRPEYGTWRKAVSVLAAEAGAEKVVLETPDCLFQELGAIPVFITLKNDFFFELQLLPAEPDATASGWRSSDAPKPRNIIPMLLDSTVRCGRNAPHANRAPARPAPGAASLRG